MVPGSAPNVNLSLLTLSVTRFNEVFGQEYNPATGTYFLSAGQQTTMNGSTLGAAAVSAAVAGYIGTRWGRRSGLLFVVMLGFLTGIVQVSATNWAGLLAGRIIGGLATGFAVNFVIPYWTETTPARIRGLIVVSYQGIVNVSQFVGQCINQGTHDLPNRWSYRAPLITEFAPAVLLLAGLYFLPETPREYSPFPSTSVSLKIEPRRLVRRARTQSGSVNFNAPHQRLHLSRRRNPS